MFYFLIAEVPVLLKYYCHATFPIKSYHKIFPIKKTITQERKVMNLRNVFSLALVMIFLVSCDSLGISPSAPGSSSNSNDQGAGPATLDVTDPDLAKQAASSISSDSQYIYESVDKAGAPLKVIQETIGMEQIEPQWAHYGHSFTSRNGQIIDVANATEGGVLNGKNFAINSKGICTVQVDKNPPKPSGAYLTSLQDVVGKLNRVETGVVINGVLTDRYELKFDNLRWKSHVTDFKSGSLYRAREGGYLVRFEYTVGVEYNSTNPSQKDFDPSKPILYTDRFELTYPKVGESFIKLPDACVGK
jgi:hypothetical protein